jgi:streptogramin lyase
LSIHRACFVLLGFMLLIGLVCPVGAQSSPVYNPANGHWYQGFRVGGLTWQQARAAAAALSYGGLPGHLVTITSPEENQFILSQVPSATQGENWIGLYQDRSAPDYREPDGGWRWITGEPYSWNDWRGEPNNANGNEDVVVMRGTVGWNDLSYTDLQYGYIVEYEPPAANAVAVTQLLLIPTSVVGGQPAIGQVVLSQFAPTGGVVVPLSSSNPAAAVVPATATVPAGTTGTTFPITTFAVPTVTPVVLTARGPGSPVSATLQVQPGSSPAVNLLVNGSFEEPPIPNGQPYRTLRPGELPGWRIVRGTVDVHQSWQQAPGQGHQSLGLVGSSAGSVEQSFSTGPGREYLFSGWVSHDYGNGVPEGRAIVYLNGAFLIQLFHNLPASEADMHWLPFSFRFRASTTVTTLTLTDVTGITDLQGTVLDGLTVTAADGASPPPTLNAPTNLTAQVTSTGQISLTWTDNSSNETGFALYRREGAADWTKIVVVGTNGTRYVDASVNPGTTYTYRVQAVNETGSSDWSNEVRTTVPPAPPVRPGDLLVTSRNTQSVLRYDGQTGAYVGAFVPSRSGGLGPSHGLVFGPDGNLYVGDVALGAVRRYNGSTGGFIDTFVAPGSGGLSYPHGMVFGPDGHLYISSYLTDSVLRYDGRSGAFLGAFVPRGSGGLVGPSALSFGPDRHLYVASEKTNSVLQYDGRTGAFLDAFVPSGSGGLDHPDGLLFGPDGELYVSSYTRCAVFRYDGRRGSFRDIFVTGGSGELKGPTKIAIGPDRNLYVVSQDNNRVLRFNGRTGAFIDTFVAQDSGGLNGPTDLVFVPGSPVNPQPPAAPANLAARAISASQIDLTWTDNSNNEVQFILYRKSGSSDFLRIGQVKANVTSYSDRGLSLSTTYTYLVRAWNPAGASRRSNEASATTLQTPYTQTIRLLVSSHDSNSILRYDGQTGAFLDTLVSDGSGGLGLPHGLAIGPDGNLYVSNRRYHSILRYNIQTGDFMGAFIPSHSGGLDTPIGLVFGPDGNLYVSSYGTDEVLRYDGRTGAFLGASVPARSGGLGQPYALLFGPDGNLYVCSQGANSIYQFDGRNGAFMRQFVTPGSGGLNGPNGLVFGPDGNLYVSSWQTHSVLRYDGHTGVFLGVFVPSHSGGLVEPWDLKFGPEGNLYVASAGSDQVLKYDGRTGAFLGPFAVSGGLSRPDWLLFVPALPATFAINGATYVASGAQETLTATFTQPDGGVTRSAYKGYVLLRVTGVGQAYGPVYNDAFYLYTGPFNPPRNGHDGGYYQLAFGTSPLTAFSLGSNARNFLVGALPPYSPAHEYPFIVDTRLVNPGQLHSGVSDGGYNDNTGAHTITVTQLVPVL